MVPRRRVSPLTHAGTDIHDKLLDQFRVQRIRQGKIELKSKDDYPYFRENGFSVEKAIKDINGNTIKVKDKKENRLMISIPDFVDYKDDLIADIKTVHFRDPPDEGGIFITEIMDTEKIDIPDNYEDATDDLYEKAMEELEKKHNSQFTRYKEAYRQATGRDPTLYIYPLIYTPTKHELIMDASERAQRQKKYPIYIKKIES